VPQPMQVGGQLQQDSERGHAVDTDVVNCLWDVCCLQTSACPIFGASAVLLRPLRHPALPGGTKGCKPHSGGLGDSLRSHLKDFRAPGGSPGRPRGRDPAAQWTVICCSAWPRGAEPELVQHEARKQHTTSTQRLRGAGGPDHDILSLQTYIRCISILLNLPTGTCVPVLHQMQANNATIPVCARARAGGMQVIYSGAGGRALLLVQPAQSEGHHWVVVLPGESLLLMRALCTR
jgi:hypothetical protein